MKLVLRRAGWQTDGAERSRRPGGTEFVEVRYRKALGEPDPEDMINQRGWTDADRDHPADRRVPHHRR